MCRQCTCLTKFKDRLTLNTHFDYVHVSPRYDDLSNRFNMPSSTRAKHRTGDHVTTTTTSFGENVIRKLIYAMINRCTKLNTLALSVPKIRTKSQNMKIGDLRRLGLLKVIVTVTDRQSAYNFSLTFYNNHVCILYRFQGTELLLESCKSFLSTCIWRLS